jgi:hypothetical protein
MSSQDPRPFADPTPEIATYWIGKRKPLPTELGLNRINWDIRYDSPAAFVHDAQDVMAANPGETPEEVLGPLALPGKYSARLTVDGHIQIASFKVINDPRSPASLKSLKEQHVVQVNTLQCIQTAWDTFTSVTEMRESLTEGLKSSNKDVLDAVKGFDRQLAKLAGKVTYSRSLGGGIGTVSPNFVALNLTLLQILSTFDSGDSAPTDANWSTYSDAFHQTQVLLDQWRILNGKPLSELNVILTKHGLKSISAAIMLPNPPEPPAKYKIKSKGPTAAGGHALPPEEGGDDVDGDSRG